MENVKTIFQETASSSVLNINEKVPAGKILACFQNYLKRVGKSATPLPGIEGILESLASAAGLNSLFDKRTVTLAEDISPLISETISYKEFCQHFIVNYTEISSIFGSSIDAFSKSNAKVNEKLKEIIAQHAYLFYCFGPKQGQTFNRQTVAMHASKKQKKKRAKGN